MIYTSDQGFFLGDHGWFDKRLMYEASLTMPLLVDAPGRTAPGSVVRRHRRQRRPRPRRSSSSPASTSPDHVQGRSFVPLLDGATPDDWPTSMYYRYWMHRDGSHGVPGALRRADARPTS